MSQAHRTRSIGLPCSFTHSLLHFVLLIGLTAVGGAASFGQTAPAAAPVPAPGGPSASTTPSDEPLLPPLTTQPGQPGSPPGSLSTQPSVTVRQFRFTGNKTVSDAELRQVVAGYVGRPLTVEDLEQARVALTKYLIEKGYINSGAVLPDQTVETGPAGGVVTYQIIEGRLSDVRVGGNKLLRGGYLTSRLKRAGEPPLDILRLKDELELLRQDPNVASINAELRPGVSPGESVLDVQVKENPPLQFGVQYSNRRPPSVGSTAVDLLLTDTDLTGNGDRLFIRYDIANGPPGDVELAGAEDFSISYSIPVTPSDTTLSFDFTRTDSVVQETPFEELDINSRSYSYALTVRQPLYRRPTFEPATATSGAKPAVEFAVFGTLAYREDETFLLGRPFVFSPATLDPKTKVWAIRLGQELTTRTQDDALSFRSTFSFGLPIFNATEAPDTIPNPSGGRPVRAADGQFISWLGQAQYLRRLGPRFRFGRLDLSDTQLVLRGAVQFSNSPLPTIEQFAIGGMDTVRGYRENQLVRDQGVAASAELRVPVLKARGGETVLTLVPFFDMGYGSDLSGVFGSTNLSSVGAGVVFTPDRHVTAQVFYGYALQNRNQTHQDLQDVGIHFSVTVLAP